MLNTTSIASIMKCTTPCIYLLILLLFGNLLVAQGFRTETQFSSGESENIMARPALDGGYVALGQDSLSLPFITKLNASGDTLWSKRGFAPNPIVAYDIIATQDSGFVVCGANGSTAVLYRFDQNGDTLFSKNYPGLGVQSANSIRELPNGDLVFTGFALSGIPLIRVNALGDTVWTKYINAPVTGGLGNTLEFSLDGGFVISGFQAAQVPDPLLIKANANGDYEWSYITTQAGYQFTDVAILPDSGFAVTSSSGLFNAKDIFLARLNAQGDTLWTRHYDLNGDEEGYGVELCTDGGLCLLVRQAATGFPPQSTALLKVDSQGNQLWTRSFPSMEIPENAFGDLTRTSDGGFIFGSKSTLGFSAWQHANVIKVDSTGAIYPNLIWGHVYSDTNANCNREPNELGLRNRAVLATDTTSSPAKYFYTTSGVNGYFEMRVPIGNYSLGMYDGSANSALWKVPPCDSSNVVVNLPTNGDTAFHNFPQIPMFECPMLQVSMVSSRIRPCWPVTYHVRYENLGTTTAYNPYIEFELDPRFTLDSASIPWSGPSSGNVITFSLDSVPILGSGEFQIHATFDSSCTTSTQGETVCAFAHIYPDSTCVPPGPNWDSASVAVTANCLGDSSVRLATYNNGTGNMNSPGHVIIIEDNILRLDTFVNLIAGDSVVWFQPANGSTWFIQAAQRPGHPGHSHPADFTEGCGLNANNTFSTGFAMGYPRDNWDVFRAQDCRTVNGPYDPNEKVVAPAGMGSEHYITPDQQLSYTLHFQNTGTDTAYNVVIIDSLPPTLDPGSILSGASSHPYTFQLIAPGIAKWTFNNILLPDSNVNEAASHGLVQFSINQAANLALQTRINNAVDIYFDYNPAITTDTAWVTLGQEEDYALVALDPTDGPTSPQIRVYPNPFSSQTNIDLGGEYTQVRLEVFDLQGRLVRQQNSPQAHALHLTTDHLPTGMYVFRVSAAGRRIGSGRLTIYQP